MSYKCPFHYINVPDKSPCPKCEEAYATRKDVSDMTLKERAHELQKWFGDVLTLNFSDLHKRIEELTSRPVWTHEMASPDALIKEVLSGEHITLSDMVKKATDVIGEDKVITVVVPETPE